MRGNVACTCAAADQATAHTDRGPLARRNSRHVQSSSRPVLRRWHACIRPATTLGSHAANNRSHRDKSNTHMHAVRRCWRPPSFNTANATNGNCARMQRNIEHSRGGHTPCFSRQQTSRQPSQAPGMAQLESCCRCFQLSATRATVKPQAAGAVTLQRHSAAQNGSECMRSRHWGGTWPCVFPLGSMF